MSFASRVAIDETGERVFVELTAEAALAKRDELRAQRRHAFIATQADELSAMMKADPAPVDVVTNETEPQTLEQAAGVVASLAQDQGEVMAKKPGKAKKTQ